MSKFETIKRATVGNLIKSDAAGDNTWIAGRILASDTKKGTITYAPADGTEDIIVKREHAYKATRAEYDAQLPTEQRPETETKEVLLSDIEHAPRRVHTVRLSELLAVKTEHAPRRVHTTVTGKKWTSDGSELTQEELDEDEKKKPLSRVKDYLDKYDVVIAASGKKSRDAGDKVAKDLRGMTLADVYGRASSILNINEEELVAKYTHLNEGQQRMVLGNRIRGHYRRLAKTEEDI